LANEPDPNPRATLGGNDPPLGRQISAEGGDFSAVTTAFLTEEHAKWPQTVATLLAEATALMRNEAGELRDIEDDAMKEKVTSLIKRFRDTAKAMEGLHAKEKAPYLRGGQAVDQFFFGLIDQCQRRDKKARPGAADVLNAKLTDYDNRKLAEEQQRRQREADEALRLAREAEAKRLEEARIAEEARLAEERARNPERKAEKGEVAAAAEQRADTATVEAKVTEQRAQEAHIATLARPADIMRNRQADGTMSTMGQEKYAEIIDRDKLDKEKLWPHISFDALQKALNGFAKATDYNTPMEGASIGRRNKSKVL
jgi:hypothetical protein